MKKVFVIVLSFLICSCNNSTKKASIENKNVELHQINFLKKKIYLPTNFRRISFDEMTTLYKKNAITEGFEIVHYSGIQNLKNLNVNFEIFCDNDNYLNSIFLFLGEYTVLNKNLVSMYVNMIEQQMQMQTDTYGIGYKRLESKFITLKNTKAIKVKYEQIYNDEIRYMTQYLITYKLHTFSIIVLSNENNEDQFLLKNNFTSY